MTSALATVVIGYYLPGEKFSSLKFNEFLSLCQKSNIKTVAIDEEYLDNAIQGQEHQTANIIIHKLTDVLTRHLIDNDLRAKEFLKKFRQMTILKKYSSPPLIMIDDLDMVKCLLDRHIQYELLNDLDNCYVPPFITIMDELIYKNFERIQKLLDDRNIIYPIICKPIRAHGPGAHNMKIIFDFDHLSDITFPCVLQQFVNHDGILIKAYLLGEMYNNNNNNFRIVYRSSIENVSKLASKKTISFTTKEVSHSSVGSKNKIDHNGLNIDEIKIKNICNSIQKKLNLNLLSIDIIIDCQLQRYAVIDVNYFPGYEGLDNLNEQLFDLCLKLYEQSKKNDINVTYASNPVAVNFTE